MAAAAAAAKNNADMQRAGRRRTELVALARQRQRQSASRQTCTLSYLSTRRLEDYLTPLLASTVWARVESRQLIVTIVAMMFMFSSWNRAVFDNVMTYREPIAESIA